jgi:hypothetical protein
MIPEHMKYRFGDKIAFEEVIPAAQEGSKVVVFCDCRPTLKKAMDIFEHKLGVNFLANYSNPMFSVNKGSIVFIITDSLERLMGYRADCYIEIRRRI